MNRIALAAALAALAACSNPDNLVVGAILGGGNVPDATIASVGSAIEGTGNITDESGHQSQRQVILLSDIAGLCEALETDPNFLASPISGFSLLAMTEPPGMVGTFYPGATGSEAGFFVAGNAGGPVYGYPGVGGTVVINELDTQVQGTFDIEFVDTLGDEYEVYGNFQTTPCAAIAGAYLPSISIATE